MLFTAASPSAGRAQFTVARNSFNFNAVIDDACGSGIMAALEEELIETIGIEPYLQMGHRYPAGAVCAG